jgi:hypothetical protein
MPIPPRLSILISSKARATVRYDVRLLPVRSNARRRCSAAGELQKQESRSRTERAGERRFVSDQTLVVERLVGSRVDCCVEQLQSLWSQPSPAAQALLQ